MNPTFDEVTMNKVIDAFVDRRMGTDAFLAATQSLCGCRPLDEHTGGRATALTNPRAGVRSTLLAICDLCRDYAYSLGPGCGYRISDDQFHREISMRWKPSRLAE